MRILVFVIFSLLIVYISLAQDLVWQGQFFKSTEFQSNKNLEFNFTVYDAVNGGTVCYNNLTNLKTGTFGEWKAEQSGLLEKCNNTSKSYFLEIMINNETQKDRRKLILFNNLFTRETRHFSEPVFSNDKIIFDSELEIRPPLNDPLHSASLTISNSHSGPLVAANIRITNDVGQAVSTGIVNSNFSQLHGPNYGGITYAGENLFTFISIGDNAGWIWEKVNTSNFPNLTSNIVMNLTQQGNLWIIGNISSDNDVKANSGFFSFLGSWASRISKLFAQDIDAINVNATNITAAQYTSLDVGEVKTGLSSSKFRVCNKFNVPSNTCDEWCKLQITGGIITGCT